MSNLENRNVQNNKYKRIKKNTHTHTYNSFDEKHSFQVYTAHTQKILEHTWRQQKKYQQCTHIKKIKIKSRLLLLRRAAQIEWNARNCLLFILLWFYCLCDCARSPCACAWCLICVSFSEEKKYVWLHSLFLSVAEHLCPCNCCASAKSKWRERENGKQILL